MVIKLVAYRITASNAILTDALESIVNILAGSFALYSVWLAEKPKDPNHPYGHGKIEFLSAGLEGLLICLAGIAIVCKSIYALFYPTVLLRITTGMYLIIVTGIINYVLGWYLEKQGKQHQSLTLTADGKHLQADAYSSLALLLGLVVIYVTRLYWLDNLIAIFFGSFICFQGFQLLKKAAKGVMDETDDQLIEQVSQIFKEARRASWIDVHNLRIIQYGAKLHIDCHVTLPFYYTLQESHREIKAIEDIINQYIPDTEIFIHMDPCLPPASCQICALKNCVKRQSAFRQKVIWNTQNIQKNQKHHLEI